MTAQRLEPFKGTEFTKEDPLLAALFMAETVEDVERARHHTASALEFGEGPGHPFRGNQWTEGESGGDALPPLDKQLEEARGVENGKNILEAMIKGKIDAEDVYGLPLDMYPSYIGDKAREEAKAEIVNGRTADITKAAEAEPLGSLSAQLMGWADTTPTYSSIYQHGDEAETPLLNGERLAVQWQVDQWKTSDDPDEVLLAKAYDGVLLDLVAPTTDAVLAAANSNPDRPSDYELVAKELSQLYVDEWAGTASDESPRAWAMQDIVAREMDAESSSFRSHTLSDEGVGRESERIIEREGEIMASFVRSEYNATQTWLREQGIKPEDPVRLYRGMGFNSYEQPEDFPISQRTATLDVDLNPASSWSVSSGVAHDFTTMGSPERSYLLTDTVLAKDIISTSLTGRGAIIEAEVLVRNRQRNDITVESL